MYVSKEVSRQRRRDWPESSLRRVK
jgi:hypothetical protein